MSDPHTPSTPTPAEGGSYMRDPATGALTRVDETATDAPAAPAPPATATTDPATTDPEPRRPRRRPDTES